MDQTAVRPAWVALPSEEELRARIPLPPHLPQAMAPSYTFGFTAGMGRLLRVHQRIGERFGALFAEIMFAPGTLSRPEREMVAAVAAAAQDCHY
jgi:hypothetical protein